MTVIHSEEPAKLLAPPEVRRKALEILRSQGYRALNDVEKMLGWDRPIGMPDNRMAQQLGVTKDQLRYILFRNERQKEAKEKRTAEKEARNVEFGTYTSSKLKFTISFPADWRVTTDVLQTEKWEAQREVSAEEAYQRLWESERAKAVRFQEFKKAYERDRTQAYRLFFEKLLGMPPDEEIEGLASIDLPVREAYNRLMGDPETFLVGFPEFKEVYERDLQQRRQAEERKAELAQMELGLFQASPPNSEDDLSVEVTKLRLSEPMNALELYELDKSPPEYVPVGNRPSKGIDVNGLHGVKYYYVFNTGETTRSQEWPKFFNVYLAENDEGWIISCSCKAGAFNHYKPVLERIIGSFRRI